MSMTMTDSSSLYAELESLILNSGPSAESPADLLAYVGSPSNSIAILDNGNITSHQISTLPHNTDTLYQACSISKPCCGLALARLMDKGYFSPDTKVCSLLPDDVLKSMISNTQTEKLFRTVTIRHLMSHTSGLSIHGFPGYPIEHHPVDTLPDAAKILTGAQGVNTWRVTLFAPPGLEFSYSGGGMTVLQIIMEHATGKKFHEIMQEEVLDPLGMTRSFYELPADERNIAEPYYTGYTKCESRWHTLPEQAAAGLWTTPTDLLKLVRAMQRSLEEDADKSLQNMEARFISREMAKQIVTKIKSSMGLTWFCNEVSLGHGGSNYPGYMCFMHGYADMPWNKKKEDNQKKDGAKEVEKNNDRPSCLEKIDVPLNCGVSVMTNAVTGLRVLAKITNAIAYLKGWPDGLTLFDRPEQGAPFAVDGDIEAGKNTTWKKWIGTWTDRDANYVVKVAESEDGKPVAGVDFDNPEGMARLRTAAVPHIRYTGGRRSTDLLIEGTEVMLRLGWEDDKEKGEMEAVHLWYFEIQRKAVLYRIGS